MKYYIQIKPKYKPNGLYLLEMLGHKQYSTTEIVENAISFESTKYDKLSPENFAFIMFDIIGFQNPFNDDKEPVSDVIIRLINKEEIAEIQELTTWKSTLVELPRNGELIAFRFSNDLSVIKKGYGIVFCDKSMEFTEVTAEGIGGFFPDNKYKTSNTTEIFWKPLIY